jgi:hypothetical protein
VNSGGVLEARGNNGQAAPVTDDNGRGAVFTWRRIR